MRASSVARAIWVAVMSSSIVSRHSLAISDPLAPAMLSHMCASVASLRTPLPMAYMSPRVYCALAVALLGGHPVPAHRYAQLHGSLTDFCHETLPLLLYNAPEIRGGTNAKALSLRADSFPVELQVRFRKQLLNP